MLYALGIAAVVLRRTFPQLEGPQPIEESECYRSGIPNPLPTTLMPPRSPFSADRPRKLLDLKPTGNSAATPPRSIVPDREVDYTMRSTQPLNIVLLLGLGALILAASEAEAHAYRVAPSSSENHLYLSIAGEVADLRITTRPAWIDITSVRARPEPVIEFAVSPSAPIGARGEVALVLHLIEPELTITHRVAVAVTASAPATQTDPRAPLCCGDRRAALEEEGRLGAGAIRLNAAPNPFAGETTLRFHTPAEGGIAELRICDITGRCVRKMVTLPLSSGEHRVTWAGEDDAGHTAPPGVYFVNIVSGNRTAACKVLLLR